MRILSQVWKGDRGQGKGERGTDPMTTMCFFGVMGVGEGVEGMLDGVLGWDDVKCLPQRSIKFGHETLVGSRCGKGEQVIRLADGKRILPKTCSTSSFFEPLWTNPKIDVKYLL